MPHFFYKSQELHSLGPVIEVTVIPPGPLVEKLKLTGQTIPNQKTIALIDTGASNSCIDKSIADSLGLVSHDLRRVLTAGGPQDQLIYDAGLILAIDKLNVFEVQILEAVLEEQPYKVLIGRDILAHLTLIYNGWDDSYTLHF